ncbi:MAG: NAD(P)H-dependent oxidoreductase [Sphingomonadales bacterium]|nr:NAD(P)H-dependent oxidoreductase [Sphingomonadales bacterium]
MNNPISMALVCSTSRQDSTSAKIITLYRGLLQTNHGLNPELFDLRELPTDFLQAILYRPERGAHAEWAQWQARVDAMDKFVFVIPEYNGSFPGILKCFVDALQFPRSFRGKKAAMIGISDGTQGAALAMSHFGDVLNYAGVTTLAFRPRLIDINKYWEGDCLINPMYHNLLTEHARQAVAM